MDADPARCSMTDGYYVTVLLVLAQDVGFVCGGVHHEVRDLVAKGTGLTMLCHAVMNGSDFIGRVSANGPKVILIVDATIGLDQLVTKSIHVGTVRKVHGAAPWASNREMVWQRTPKTEDSRAETILFWLVQRVRRLSAGWRCSLCRLPEMK